MKHILSGVLTSQHRTAIGATVDELVVQPGSEKAFELMDVVQSPAGIIEHEIVSSYGGMTQERALNTEGKQVAGVSSNTRIFKPGSWQEFHRLAESEILKLRKFGTIGERGVTGLTDGELNYTGRVGKKLQVRIKNRMQDLIWKAIFEGKFNYMGVEFDFMIPDANKLTSTTDWSDVENAEIVADLEKVLFNTDVTRKYIFKEILLNPITASYVRQAIMKKFQVVNSNVKTADLKDLVDFYIPGLPALTVVKDMWQDETVSEAGIVTAGHAKYFVPDNKLLLVPDFSGAEYPKYGEFELTENLNDPNATIDNPTPSIYTFVDEKGLENKKSPHMDVVAGFNGGPNLKRSNDVLILSV